jgi:cytochrome c peroxidase
MPHAAYGRKFLAFAIFGAILAHLPTAHAADCGGERCDAVARGVFDFVDRHPKGLGSNGRSCADCHMPFDSLQLSPAGAEARFQLLQRRRHYFPNAVDPLFLPIDADDFRINGQNATDFSNLRQNGLIRITMPLPAKVRLVDPLTNAPSAETTIDIWRAVPSVFNVRLTGPDNLNPWPRGPNASGGFQLDARVGTLAEQAHGAFMNHAQAQAEPTAGLLDDLAALEQVLFSSARVRQLSDAVRSGASSLPDIDPPLDALQAQGKVTFIRSCAQCHGGPGMSTPQPPVVRFHDISTQCPRPVDTVSPPRFLFTPCPDRLARNARTYEITQINGTVARRVSSDPGRALLTGFVGGPAAADDWNKLDMPGLRGIAHTAPYFHNNSAATLEDVADHYVQFYKRVQVNAPPGVVPPIATTDGVHFDRALQPEERDALVAYLRTL